MELQLPIIKIEAITPQFLYRGKLQPRGELFTFLNDRRFLTYHFMETAFHPLMDGYRINTIKPEVINVKWTNLIYIALVDEADMECAQLMQFGRPVTFYTRDLAIRGNLRVNPDSHENDLIDETRSFLGVSDATIFPLHPLAVTPTQRVPMLALNWQQIESYHVYQPKES
jgi:hypothetical protein